MMVDEKKINSTTEKTDFLMSSFTKYFRNSGPSTVPKIWHQDEADG